MTSQAADRELFCRTANPYAAQVDVDVASCELCVLLEVGSDAAGHQPSTGSVRCRGRHACMTLWSSGASLYHACYRTTKLTLTDYRKCDAGSSGGG